MSIISKDEKYQTTTTQNFEQLANLKSKKLENESKIGKNFSVANNNYIKEFIKTINKKSSWK